MLIEVRVIPGARRSEVTGLVDGILRVRVAAQAVDDQANREVVRVLAAHFNVKPRHVVIERGAHHRTKLVTIRDTSGSVDQSLIGARAADADIRSTSSFKRQRN